MFAGSVIFFEGHGRIVAVAHSAGDGTSCFIGVQGASLPTYKEWPTLWEMVGMTEGLDDDSFQGLDAYLDQFPEGLDDMFAFVATKLGQLFSS